jgi:fucose 4-O-acetylase-like acetyltransferase
MENQDNREYQFDFIKGIAIISVILLHAGISRKYFSFYWIGQAVPLFIIVSCLLGCLSLLSNNNIKCYFNRKKIKKIFIRIFAPFILTQIMLVIIHIILNKFSPMRFLAKGGIGPGSYYPWLYLQLWILIPLMFSIMKRNAVFGSIIIILFSVGTNVLFVTISSADLFQVTFVNYKSLYRLCVNRYLFLFPLAFLLVEQKLKYGILLFLGFAGAGFVYCLEYKNITIEPYLYNSGWQRYEFPGHFYTLLVFIFLYKIYNYIPNILQNIVNKIGKHSWEIFNIQMVYFTLNRYLNLNKYVNLILSLFICIIPIYTYEFMNKPIQIKAVEKHGHCT